MRPVSPAISFRSLTLRILMMRLSVKAELATGMLAASADGLNTGLTVPPSAANTWMSTPAVAAGLVKSGTAVYSGAIRTSAGEDEKWEVEAELSVNEYCAPGDCMDDNDGNSVAAGADDDLEEGERIIWEEAANGDIDT